MRLIGLSPRNVVVFMFDFRVRGCAPGLTRHPLGGHGLISRDVGLARILSEFDQFEGERFDLRKNAEHRGPIFKQAGEHRSLPFSSDTLRKADRG
jgi:hypothetical protein